MRLLHVVPTYVPAYSHGGPVFAVHGLCTALVERGHRVRVFTTDVDGAGRLDVPLAKPVDVDGVEVSYFPVRQLRRLYFAQGFRAALEGTLTEIDLLHLHSVFLWPTSAAARAAERRGIPYVLAPRGMLVPELMHRRGRWRKALWLRLVERRTLRRAAALHCTSTLEAADAARIGVRLPPIVVVPNGVDRALPPPADEIVSEVVRAALASRPLILFLGRLSWKKGIERLVNLLPLVPQVHIALAGPDEDGLRPGLEALACRLGGGERLHFLGSVAGADKAALLAGCDLFVLPSLSENFGNAVLEAMAAGTAVVVTPEVGLAEEISHAGAGVVSAGDAESLAKVCGSLLADPARRRELGERARRLVAERFSWPQVAAQMENAYQEILAHSPRPKGVA